MDMAKMLRDLLKPRAHGQECFLLLYATPGLKALVSQFTKWRTSIASKNKNVGSECEMDETVEKKNVFMIESSSLLHARDICSYRETTAAKQAARTSVVEAVLQF